MRYEYRQADDKEKHTNVLTHLRPLIIEYEEVKNSL